MSQRDFDLTREALEQSARGDRRIVMTQMILAAVLILSGGIMGLVAMAVNDGNSEIALALGTAVIGAGAAMLPTGAAAGASARILHLPEPYAMPPRDPRPEVVAPAVPPRVVGVTAPMRADEAADGAARALAADPKS